jgi:peptidyl-prolyl cis-trans isomerase C
MRPDRTRLSRLLALVAAGLVTGAGGMAARAQTPAPDAVVATVDGIKITEREIAIAAEDLASSLQQVPDAQRRDYLVGYMADLKLGARAAAQAKVGEGADFQQRMAYQRDKLLLDEYLVGEAKKAVTEEKMKALYADSVKDLKPEAEVNARHILVETEDQAKAVLVRLKAGEDFAKVSADVSKDPGSGKEGGDLGWFTKDRMVPEFAEAAFKLDKGQLSDPVKSQFGWHVIRLEDKRNKPVPTYDEVKDQVAQYLTRKSQTDIIMALRAKGKVERLDQPKTDAKPADGKPAEPKKP